MICVYPIFVLIQLDNLLILKNIYNDENKGNDDDVYTVCNGISKMSVDDYTYDTMVIGHKLKMFRRKNCPDPSLVQLSYS